MKSRFLIFLLFAAPFVAAFAQTLPAGHYVDSFQRGRLLAFDVGTNGPIALSWLRFTTNPITGTAISHRIFYGEATNKPNGVITGKFPGHGRMRGRVRDGGTNGAIGTLRLWIDGQRSPVRRFHVQADSANFTSEEPW